jgi:hypothetical protein
LGSCCLQRLDSGRSLVVPFRRESQSRCQELPPREGLFRREALSRYQELPPREGPFRREALSQYQEAPRRVWTSGERVRQHLRCITAAELRRAGAECGSGILPDQPTMMGRADPTFRGTARFPTMESFTPCGLITSIRRRGTAPSITGIHCRSMRTVGPSGRRTTANVRWLHKVPRVVSNLVGLTAPTSPGATSMKVRPVPRVSGPEMCATERLVRQCRARG